MSRKKIEMMKRLAQLTDVAFQVAQANLRRHTETENRHMQALQQLSEDRTDVLNTLQLGPENSPAQIISNARWLVWAERQRAMTNLELARARAASLTHKEAARKAFGRNQVAQKLKTK